MYIQIESHTKYHILLIVHKDFFAWSIKILYFSSLTGYMLCELLVFSLLIWGMFSIFL